VLGTVVVRALEDARFESPLVFTVTPSMDLGREQRSSDDPDPSPGSSIQTNVCITPSHHFHNADIWDQLS